MVSGVIFGTGALYKENCGGRKFTSRRLVLDQVLEIDYELITRNTGNIEAQYIPAYRHEEYLIYLGSCWRWHICGCSGKEMAFQSDVVKV